MLTTFHVSATKHLADGGLQSCELVLRIDEATGLIDPRVEITQVSYEYGKRQPSEFAGG